MKKNVYKLQGIDCANCGVKLSNKVSKLNGIYYSNFTFMTERLIVLFDENVLDEYVIENTITSIVAGVKIISKREMSLSNEDLSFANKKNDKVKMILFRKKK